MGVPAADVIPVAHILVELLAQRLHPAVTRVILGDVQLPVPLIELHIAGGTGTSAYGDVEDMELDILMILEALGTRRGIGVIYQGGQYLPQDLVDAGRGMRL